MLAPWFRKALARLIMKKGNAFALPFGLLFNCTFQRARCAASNCAVMCAPSS